MASEDVYVFVFLLGLVADDKFERQKAQQANLPLHLIKPFPKNWARPASWHSLGTLMLKCDTSLELQLSLSGQDADRQLYPGIQSHRARILGCVRTHLAPCC